MAQVRPVRRRPALSRVILAAALAALAAAAPADAAAPAAPSAEFYGVTSATELSGSEFSIMNRGGVGTLRVPVYWPHVEGEAPESAPNPVPGLPPVVEDRTRWGTTDALVERAARHGIRLLPFIYGTPDWVADDRERPPIDDARARAAWQDFLGDLVRRYGPGGRFWRDKAVLDPDLPVLPITDWQVWNEANSPVFFSPRPSPSEYRTLVELAGEAIRAADPAATIVLGGMFGAPTNGIRAWDFLRRFHRGAATGAFDAYALHPYAPTLAGIARQARRINREITAGPMPDAPLSITEIGWPTDGPEDFNLVQTLNGQKRLLARSFRLFLANRETWNVDRVIWYVWRDNDVQLDCTVCRYSGLFTQRLDPKPAWRKLTQFTGGSP